MNLFSLLGLRHSCSPALRHQSSLFSGFRIEVGLKPSPPFSGLQTQTELHHWLSRVSSLQTADSRRWRDFSACISTGANSCNKFPHTYLCISYWIWFSGNPGSYRAVDPEKCNVGDLPPHGRHRCYTNDLDKCVLKSFVQDPQGAQYGHPP